MQRRNAKDRQGENKWQSLLRSHDVRYFRTSVLGCLLYLFCKLTPPLIFLIHAVWPRAAPSLVPVCPSHLASRSAVRSADERYISMPVGGAGSTFSAPA